MNILNRVQVPLDIKHKFSFNDAIEKLYTFKVRSPLADAYLSDWYFVASHYVWRDLVVSSGTKRIKAELVIFLCSFRFGNGSFRPSTPSTKNGV